MPKKGAPDITGPCKVLSRGQRRDAYRDFLRKHGDDLPEATIKSMTSEAHLDNWSTLCDKGGNLAAVGHYELMEWYNCNVKGIAVRADLRGHGLGNDITSKVVEKAKERKSDFGTSRCLVLGADVTYDNHASLGMLKRNGFEAVSEFCWGKGQKPAHEVQLVRFKPKDHQCDAP